MAALRRCARRGAGGRGRRRGASAVAGRRRTGCPPTCRRRGRRRRWRTAGRRARRAPGAARRNAAGVEHAALDGGRRPAGRARRRRVLDAEHRQRRRHGDLVADGELADGLPATRREQRVGRGDRHRPAGRGAQPEHRLHAVLDARADVERRLAAVAVEAADRQRATRRGPIGELAGRDDLAGRDVDHRRVPRDALAHRRAGPDDVQRRRLQARQQLVDVVVAGGRAGDRVAPGVGLLEAVHHRLDRLAEQLRGVGDAVLGDLEDLGLGVVDGLGHVVGLAVGHLGDVAGDVDQAPQQRGVLDDAGVVGGVGDRRRGVLQGVQRLRAADLLEQAVAAQLVGDGDRVGRRTRRVQGPHGVEDVLVRRAVEVLRAQPLLGDRADGVTRQQQRAEHGLLGLQVVRRHAPGARRAPRAAVVVAVAAEPPRRPFPPSRRSITAPSQGDRVGRQWTSAEMLGITRRLRVDGVWTSPRPILVTPRRSRR